MFHKLLPVLICHWDTYIYPNEKHLAIFCYGIISYNEYILGYDGENMKTLLCFSDSVEKDECFISKRARVGVYHPVSPAMYYWDSEKSEYVQLNINEIPIEDFLTIYKGEDIIRELKNDTYSGKYNYIYTIGNYKYLIYFEDGCAVVSRDEENNYEIDIPPHYVDGWDNGMPLDVDYFEACRRMIPVEEW